jgi:hypothetical protein
MRLSVVTPTLIWHMFLGFLSIGCRQGVRLVADIHISVTFQKQIVHSHTQIGFIGEIKFYFST